MASTRDQIISRLKQKIVRLEFQLSGAESLEDITDITYQLMLAREGLAAMERLDRLMGDDK